MTTLRLFTAVELPGAMRHCVHAAAETLLREPAGLHGRAARAVPAENLHVTLRFLGAVAEERVPSIVDAMQQAVAALAPGEIRLPGFAVFPSRRRPRGLWCEVDDASGVLARLERALTAVFEPLGFPPEERAFRPHVTVARFRDERTALLCDEHTAQASVGHVAAARILDESARMLVERVTLFRSIARAAEKHTGSRYDALDGVQLAGVQLGGVHGGASIATRRVRRGVSVGDSTGTA